MNNTVSLNDLYADFSAGLLEKREFEDVIFKNIGEDIRRLPGLGREDYDDFISWLYPRISSAVTAYREKGSSFEAYIGTMVRLAVKEYRYRQMRGYTAESSIWATQVPEMYTAEEETHYDECPVAVLEKPVKARNPRQLLILTLKCCSYISDDFLERISSRLGVEPEVLRELTGRLRDVMIKREQKRNQLRERINNQFFRNIYYEKCLQNITEDSALALRMAEKLERGRNRVTRMRKQLTRLRPDPSNRQIADLLGIAKGTVDATLFNIKGRWNIGPEENILN